MATEVRIQTARDVVSVYLRHSRTFILSWWLFAILVLALVLVLPMQYTATARFEHRTQAALSDEGLSGVTSKEALEAARTTLPQELASLEAVGAVAEKLKMFKDLPATNNDLAKRLRIATIASRVTVRYEKTSLTVDLIAVSYTDTDPDLAFTFPNELIQRYAQNVPAEARKRLRDSRDFLTGRVKDYDDQLHKLNDKKIQLETDTPGLMENQHGDIVYRDQLARSDQDAVRHLLQIAKQKYARLQALKKESTTSSEPTETIKGPNPEMERLGSELREYKVQLDLAMTLNHMTKEHPAVKTLLERIAIMEERIRNTPTEIVLQKVFGAGAGADLLANQVAAAQAEVEFLEAEYDRVTSQVAGYEEMYAHYGPARKEYSQVMDDINRLSTEAKSWQARYRQVEMAMSAESANMRTDIAVVEKAKKPDSPSFPRLTTVFGVAFGGGLLFAGLLTFLAVRKDRTIATVEEAVDYFGLTIHGQVGEISSGRAQLAQRARSYVIMPLVIVLMLVGTALACSRLILRAQGSNDVLPAVFHVQ